MKRVFRVRGQRRFYGFCCLVFFGAMMALLHLGRLAGVQTALPELLLFDFLCLLAGTLVILEIFVIRVETDEEGFRTFDMLNRKRAELTYEDVSSYMKEGPSGWVVRSGGEVVRLGKIDKQQFHSLMAEKAPGALNAKLWKCGQLPPSRDFSGLGIFDWNIWITNAIGAGMISGVIGLFSRGYALGYFASSLLQISYHFKDLFGRLDITEQGVAARWPWERRAIGWDELTAVFCENGASGFSSFVVTAPGRSIFVPAHVLADPEVRRKFFYSIPDLTKCVNFDKLRFKRRGKGKRVEEPMGALDPLMTP